MRTVVLILCTSLVALHEAGAQTVEVGGTISAACAGSDGSICDDFEGYHPLLGAHASWWATDRIELAARVAHMGQRPLRIGGFEASGVSWLVTDRRREFVSFLFTYHFMPRRRVRPMLGLGSGWYTSTETISCETPGCEALLPSSVTTGEHREWLVDAILIIGLSGEVRSRWVWRAGWQAHRFANDENSTYEWFGGVGYRFGSRRP
jgi:hypothetical protein